MKLVNHWKVGEIVLDRLGQYKINEYNINKLAYLMGNVIPDINCIYPAHRLRTTYNRFTKHIKHIDNTHNKFIKSLYLGVVTHYLCDYFCYAHTSESLGVTHKRYENNLYSFFLEYRDVVDYRRLTDFFNSIKQDITDIISEDNMVNTEYHCTIILEQIELMNKQYIKEMIPRESKLWTDDKTQIKTDMEYIMFMLNNILGLIIDPYQCARAYV